MLFPTSWWCLQVVTPFSMLSGCSQGIISIFWWAVINMQDGETYSQVRTGVVLTLDSQWLPQHSAPSLLLLGQCCVDVHAGDGDLVSTP